MRNLNDFINYSASQTVIDLSLKFVDGEFDTKIKVERKVKHLPSGTS
jgi:hypothetical protein